MSSSSEQQRVIIIDDSEIILERAKLSLEGENFEVVTTTQTVGIAKLLREECLVLIDFHMPGINGGDLVTSLRSAARRSGTTCGLYIYSSDTEKAAKYAKLGFDGAFFSKGDMNLLVAQTIAAARTVKLRAMKQRRTLIA
ncbi:MAG: response regulator [Myxococcota bacterium]